ncbi:MAG: hypothetical protein AAFQ45_14180 [Pseudomonadota bacterium]
MDPATLTNGHTLFYVWLGALLLPAALVLSWLPLKALMRAPCPQARLESAEMLRGYTNRALRQQLGTQLPPPEAERRLRRLMTTLAALLAYASWVVILGLVGTSVVIAG